MSISSDWQSRIHEDKTNSRGFMRGGDGRLPHSEQSLSAPKGSPIWYYFATAHPKLPEGDFGANIYPKFEKHCAPKTRNFFWSERLKNMFDIFLSERLKFFLSKVFLQRLRFLQKLVLIVFWRAKNQFIQRRKRRKLPQLVIKISSGKNLKPVFIYLIECVYRSSAAKLLA